MRRPTITKDLERRVKVEAGHRCAIPTCKAPVVEICHIEPWSKVKEHTFDNLIALCPTCHDLFDKKKQIDRQSMLMYKANLMVLNSAYSSPERQLIDCFVRMVQEQAEEGNDPWTMSLIKVMPAFTEFLINGLIADGYLDVIYAPEEAKRQLYANVTMGDETKAVGLLPYAVQLNAAGKAFLQSYMAGNAIR